VRELSYKNELSEISKMALSKGIGCHLFSFKESLAQLISQKLTRKLINDTEINIVFRPMIICTFSFFFFSVFEGV
jgi:hypothetical protein